MKAKYALIIFVLGYCVDFFAAWAKITHQAYGNTAIFLGATIKIFGALLLLYKVLTHPKMKEFLNW